jgi:hypothetical protein
MNINSSSPAQSVKSAQRSLDRLSAPQDKSMGAVNPYADSKRSKMSSPVDRFAQNASDLKHIKGQYAPPSNASSASVTGSAATQSLRAEVLGQNGIVSKSVQGLPQPQNLPSTLSILKNRQNTQNPSGPGAYSFAKAYVEKTPTNPPNATALLGSGSSSHKNPPAPNPALSPPPPRGAQLQLYAPSLKAGNKALDIQDHGINAF